MDRLPPITLDRRALLRRGALVASGAAAAPLLAAGRAGAASPAPAGDPSPPPRTESFGFFEDASLNFAVLFPVGAAAYGAADPGEVLTAINAINARGSGFELYAGTYEVFLELARRTASQAGAARSKGHRATARDAYLRAAEYFTLPLFYTLATADATRRHERSVYRALRRSWNRFVALSDGRIEPISIPYGRRSTLPGWLVKPPGARGRRPTLIVNNGSDAQMVELWSAGVAAAVERGYNALVFEGPGQGSLLFERDVPFRPDWENVIRPVVDVLRARDDVDRRRIALSGSSFGGYLVTRAAAFERRLAAVIADPGVVNTNVGWRTLPPFFFEDAKQGKDAAVDAAWASFLAGAPPQTRFGIAKRSEIYGRPSFAAQLRYMLKFDAAAVVRRIRTPFLVLDPEEESFYPGEAQRLYRSLRSPKKLQKFTVAQGAQFHCEPMAPRVRSEAVFDWLDDVLGL